MILAGMGVSPVLAVVPNETRIVLGKQALSVLRLRVAFAPGIRRHRLGVVPA
jgi:hypothetical protein